MHDFNEEDAKQFYFDRMQLWRSYGAYNVTLRTAITPMSINGLSLWVGEMKLEKSDSRLLFWNMVLVYHKDKLPIFWLECKLEEYELLLPEF